MNERDSGKVLYKIVPRKENPQVRTDKRPEFKRSAKASSQKAGPVQYYQASPSLPQYSDLHANSYDELCRILASELENNREGEIVREAVIQIARGIAAGILKKLEVFGDGTEQKDAQKTAGQAAEKTADEAAEKAAAGKEFDLKKIDHISLQHYKNMLVERIREHREFAREATGEGDACLCRWSAVKSEPAYAYGLYHLLMEVNALLKTVDEIEKAQKNLKTTYGFLADNLFESDGLKLCLEMTKEKVPRLLNEACLDGTFTDEKFEKAEKQYRELQCKLQSHLNDYGKRISAFIKEGVTGIDTAFERIIPTVPDADISDTVTDLGGGRKKLADLPHCAVVTLGQLTEAGDLSGDCVSKLKTAHIISEDAEGVIIVDDGYRDVPPLPIGGDRVWFSARAAARLGLRF